MNIMPKHESHAIVASFDSQYWQRGESDEIAAPQFGQLRVSAFIPSRHERFLQLNIVRVVANPKVLDGSSVPGAIWKVSIERNGLSMNEIEAVR
jgi:hypothetical protein